VFKKDWSPAEAQRWTKEDYLAMVFSVLAYFGFGIGTPMAFFHWIGYVFLAIGVVSTLIMIAVIEPKLKAVSADYEAKQQQYLLKLQRIISWED
jgi:hypothetical protein